MSEFPNTAEVFDSILVWNVPSRSKVDEVYRVDLGAYNGEGMCACKDFGTRFEKFLKRGYTPQLVWDEKWITELRDYQLSPEDCLSCWHLVNARRMASRQIIRAFRVAKKAQGEAPPQG